MTDHKRKMQHLLSELKSLDIFVNKPKDSDLICNRRTVKEIADYFERKSKSKSTEEFYKTDYKCKYNQALKYEFENMKNIRNRVYRTSQITLLNRPTTRNHCVRKDVDMHLLWKAKAWNRRSCEMKNSLIETAKSNPTTFNMLRDSMKSTLVMYVLMLEYIL